MAGESATEQLRAFKERADSLLSAYKDLHDRCWKKQATLWSIIRRRLGFRVPHRQRVPYRQLHRESEAMEERWRGLCESIRTFQDNRQGALTPDQRDYVKTLLRYADAVTAAISLLRERQAMLLGIGQGGAGSGASSKPSWRDLRDVGRRYREAAALFGYTIHRGAFERRSFVVSLLRYSLGGLLMVLSALRAVVLIIRGPVEPGNRPTTGDPALDLVADLTANLLVFGLGYWILPKKKAMGRTAAAKD